MLPYGRVSAYADALVRFESDCAGSQLTGNEVRVLVAFYRDVCSELARIAGEADAHEAQRRREAERFRSRSAQWLLRSA
jgi:hypothetical protein